MAEEVEMTPITPAEGGSVPPKVAPFGASPAPAASAPAAPAAEGGASTIKLKPVIRKPMIHKPTIGGPKPLAPVAPKPAPQPAASEPAPAQPAAPAAAVPPTLKRATQNLKSVTGPIPVQATLRKTGIIAEGIITPAQQQAAKSKTSRISLESAIGVAPAKEGPAPLKTIRLRRPADLKTAAPAPAPMPAPGSADALKAPAPLAAAEPAAEPDASETQKKTLKLHRPGLPGAGVKKPTLGVKKAEPAAESEVADIPEMPVGDLKPLAPVSAKDECAGVPKTVAVLSLITTLAALLVIGAVAYFFYLEGCGPDAGANAMPFIHTEA